MIIRVPEELVELAEIFKKNKEKLYLVGGYIRNQILGVPDKLNVDIDICSSVHPDKVLKMLEGTEFAASYMNKEVGVIEIKKNIRVEHATFRQEKYAFSGLHLPNNIEFIKDINIDCERRDFRCNAIYYDIINEELVDPLGGVSDIEKKIIRTTREPNVVFSEDAERILRMVRFASTLGFSVEDKTYKAAKKNVSKLAMISSTRKREEFSKIVLADTKYDFLSDVKRAHARGVLMLADLGALKYILPALDAIMHSGIVEDRGKLLFEHIMNVFAFSAPEVRLSALLHDVGKAKAYLTYKNFHGSEELAPIIIEKNLGIDGLNYSKKIVERVKRVVLGADFNKRGLETAKNIRHFIAAHPDEIELIIALKNAIALDKSNLAKRSHSAKVLGKTYNKMKANNTPLSLAELNIRGDVLINNLPNLKQNKTGDLLNALLYRCIDKPYLNTEEMLLALAGKLVNKRNSKFAR